ncbi:MAG: ABC transporter substrate-binding protein [Halanaeroarchaeum sp.]
MTVACTLACTEYDWTAPLWDGRVQPEGIDLTTVNYPNPERFTRMVDRLEFDACELSMGTYLASRAADADYPITAIPVFPYRRFRHSFVYVREGAEIESPADLNGGRIGLVNWQTTTGIWQRGILAERHGLDLDGVEWVVAGSEIVPVDPPVDVTPLDARHGSALPLLEEELERGALDALFVPVHPDTDAAVRLFDDPVDVERAYARETGIFPIMHAIALREAFVEEHPWAVQSLYDAFETAKARAMRTLEDPRTLPLAWVRPLVDRQRSVLGDDPWEYGLGDRNRTTLERLLGYAVDQGVAAPEATVESLFATDHLNPPWFGAT